MADKKITAGDEDDLDIDWSDDTFEDEDDAFDDEMDFDFEPKVVKDDRKPIYKAVDGAKEGFKNTIKDKDVIVNALKRALPPNIRKSVDIVDQNAYTVKDAYDKSTQSIRDIQKIAKKNIRRYESIVGAVLPKQIADKINKFAKEEDGGFGDYRPQTDEQIKEGNIQHETSELLRLKEEITEKRHREDTLNTYTQIGNQIKGIDVSQRILERVQALTAYQDSVGLRYQQKMIELNMRQYHAQAGMLAILSEHRKDVGEQLRAITKNTSLPDLAKSLNSEVAKDVGLRRLFTMASESIGSKLGLDKKLPQLVSHLSKTLTEKIGTVKDLAETMSEMQSAQDDMDMQMGGVKYDESEFDAFIRSGGRTAGEEAGKTLYGWLGKKLGKKLANNKYGASINEHVGRINQTLGRKLNKFYRGDYDPESIFWYDKINKIRNFLDLDELVDSEKHGESAWHTQQNLYDRTEFNNYTQKSITEIIPGLLSRILKSTESMRLGRDVPMVTFSHKLDKFVTSDERDNEIRKTILSDNSEVAYADKLATILGGGKDKLSDADRKELRSSLIKLARHGNELDTSTLESLMYGEYNKKISKEGREAISQYLRKNIKMTDYDTIDKFDVDSQKFITKLATAFNVVANNTVSPVDKIKSLTREGIDVTDYLKSIGLLKQGENESNISNETYYRLLEDYYDEQVRQEQEQSKRSQSTSHFTRPERRPADKPSKWQSDIIFNPNDLSHPSPVSPVQNTLFTDKDTKDNATTSSVYQDYRHYGDINHNTYNYYYADTVSHDSDVTGDDSTSDEDTDLRTKTAKTSKSVHKTKLTSTLQKTAKIKARQLKRKLKSRHQVRFTKTKDDIKKDIEAKYNDVKNYLNERVKFKSLGDLKSAFTQSNKDETTETPETAEESKTNPLRTRNFEAIYNRKKRKARRDYANRQAHHEIDEETDEIITTTYRFKSAINKMIEDIRSIHIPRPTFDRFKRQTKEDKEDTSLHQDDNKIKTDKSNIFIRFSDVKKAFSQKADRAMSFFERKLSRDWVRFEDVSAEMLFIFHRYHGDKFDQLVKKGDDGHVYMNIKRLANYERKRLGIEAPPDSTTLKDKIKSKADLFKQKLREHREELKRKQEAYKADRLKRKKARDEHDRMFRTGIIDRFTGKRRKGSWRDKASDSIRTGAKKAGEFGFSLIPKPIKLISKGVATIAGGMTLLVAKLIPKLIKTVFNVPKMLGGLIKFPFKLVRSALGIVEFMWPLFKRLGKGVGRLLWGAGKGVYQWAKRGGVKKVGQFAARNARLLGRVAIQSARFLVTNPLGWAVIGIATAAYVGYRLWKYFKDSAGPMDEYRIATYGIHANNDPAKFNKLLAFEKEMEKIHRIDPKTGKVKPGGMDVKKWAGFFWDTERSGELYKDHFLKVHVPQFNRWFKNRFFPNFCRHKEALYMLQIADQDKEDINRLNNKKIDGLYDIESNLANHLRPAMARMTFEDPAKTAPNTPTLYADDTLPFSDMTEGGGLSVDKVKTYYDAIIRKYQKYEDFYKNMANQSGNAGKKGIDKEGNFAFESAWNNRDKLLDQMKKNEADVKDGKKKSVIMGEDPETMHTKNDKVKVNIDGKVVEMTYKDLPPEMKLGKELSDFQAMRFLTYGLKPENLTREYCQLLLELEWWLINRQLVKDTSENDGKHVIENVMNVQDYRDIWLRFAKRFKWSKDNEKHKENWFKWFHQRFLVIFGRICARIRSIDDYKTLPFDRMDALIKDPENLYKIAEYMYSDWGGVDRDDQDESNIEKNLSTMTIPEIIERVGYQMIAGLPMNMDPESLKYHIDNLENGVKSEPLEMPKKAITKEEKASMINNLATALKGEQKRWLEKRAKMKVDYFGKGGKTSTIAAIGKGAGNGGGSLTNLTSGQYNGTSGLSLSSGSTQIKDLSPISLSSGVGVNIDGLNFKMTPEIQAQIANNRKYKDGTLRNYRIFRDLFHKVATGVGAPEDIMIAIASNESGFNPFATPGIPGQTAGGFFQFTDGTWGDVTKKYGKPYGITPQTSKFDPVANALMGAHHIRENIQVAQKFKSSLGLGDSVDLSDIYGMHFLGQGGWRSFTRAYVKNPNAPISSVLSPEAMRVNKGMVYEGIWRNRKFEPTAELTLAGVKGNLYKHATSKSKAIFDAFGYPKGSSLGMDSGKLTMGTSELKGLSEKPQDTLEQVNEDTSKPNQSETASTSVPVRHRADIGLPPMDDSQGSKDPTNIDITKDEDKTKHVYQSNATVNTSNIRLTPTKGIDVGNTNPATNIATTGVGLSGNVSKVFGGQDVLKGKIQLKNSPNDLLTKNVKSGNWVLKANIQSKPPAGYNPQEQYFTYNKVNQPSGFPTDIDHLDPNFRESFNQLAYIYNTDPRLEATRLKLGDRLHMTSAVRSQAYQMRLKQLGYKAATNGLSLHQYGMAIDANPQQLEALDKLGLLQSVGLYRPKPQDKREKQHLQPTSIVAVDRQGQPQGEGSQSQATKQLEQDESQIANEDASSERTETTSAKDAPIVSPVNPMSQRVSQQAIPPSTKARVSQDGNTIMASSPPVSTMDMTTAQKAMQTSSDQTSMQKTETLLAEQVKYARASSEHLKELINIVNQLHNTTKDNLASNKKTEPRYPPSMSKQLANNDKDDDTSTGRLGKAKLSQMTSGTIPKGHIKTS